MRQLMKVKVDDLWMDEVFNSRDKIQLQHIMDLAQSIKQDGLINPISIQKKKGPKGETYKVIAGHRRTKAYKALQTEGAEFDEVEAILMPDGMSEIDARIMNLNENLARKDLNILEEAKSLLPLMELGMTEAEMGRALPSANRGWIQVRLMLLKLPPEIQRDAASGLLGQVQIRDLYTVMINTTDRDILMTEFRKAKDAKIKGESYKIKAKKGKTSNNRKHPSQIKHTRARPEMFSLMRHMIDNNLTGLQTRVLAWCAGEISDDDLLTDFENHFSEYKRPFGIDYSIGV